MYGIKKLVGIKGCPPKPDIFPSVLCKPEGHFYGKQSAYFKQAFLQAILICAFAIINIHYPFIKD
jgi:hypothetical protein